MKPLTRAELEVLMQPRDGVAISMYSPMIEAGPETQQNPIRFKNLVRRAVESLEERGWSQKDAEALLAPAAELVDDYEFWQHQSAGFACLVADGFFQYHRVPVEVRELVVIEDRFHLKPLLPLLTDDGRFYILALSQKKVRLFEATRHAVREIDLGDLPTSLEDAVGYRVEEAHVQFHTGNSSPRTSGRAPMYHGHGGGEDDVKPEIRKFFNLLDNAIGPKLADKNAPLVLAGVEYLFPLYEGVSHHPHLIHEGVTGNPDGASAEEIHAKAWEVVEPVFQGARRKAADRFADLNGTGSGSGDLEEVVVAAHDGRIASLFVALGERAWGSYDPETRSVELADDHADGNQDLVDLAAIKTLLMGGTVFAVDPDEMPDGGTSVAAVYRY